MNYSLEASAYRRKLKGLSSGIWRLVIISSPPTYEWRKMDWNYTIENRKKWCIFFSLYIYFTFIPGLSLKLTAVLSGVGSLAFSSLPIITMTDEYSTPFYFFFHHIFFFIFYSALLFISCSKPYFLHLLYPLLVSFPLSSLPLLSKTIII